MGFNLVSNFENCSHVNFLEEVETQNVRNASPVVANLTKSKCDSLSTVR